MNIYKYETFIDDIGFNNCPSIFLAGPTVRGNQTHLVSWRKQAIDIFISQNFEGNVILPEFPTPIESDEVRYDLPQWEFEAMRNSHCIMFWVPRTKELIGLTTNYEIGYWTAREREKVVYGRPRDAYRIQYIDIMWVEDRKERYKKNSGANIYTTLTNTIKASIEKATKIYESKIPF